MLFPSSWNEAVTKPALWIQSAGCNENITFLKDNWGEMRKEVVVAAAVTAVAVVAVLVRQYSRKKARQWRQTQRILRKFARESATPVPKLWEVANAMVSDMQASLASQEETGTLSMLVSCAASLPKGYKQSSSSSSGFTCSILLHNIMLTLLNLFWWNSVTRDERGLYYGVNLRGTNFLILCARLGGRNEPISDLHRKEISIPPNVLIGTSQVCL